MLSIAEQIAQELNVKTTQVNTAINLLDDGSTVPFIARYRKEATQGLDDSHLRHLAQRLIYLRELADRRQVILTSIKQQNKLTDALQKQIEQADNKTRLEDLYLPYKPKRRTKGKIANEAGIAPLAEALLNNWQLNPMIEASKYLNKVAGFEDEKSVLEGASYILAEQFAEDANLLQKLRRHLLKQAHLTSKVIKGKEQLRESGKFKDYFQHSELLKSVPSHRMLAMLRGRNEGVLQLSLNVDPQSESKSYSSAEQIILEHFNLTLSKQSAAEFLTKVVQLTWKAKLSVSLSTELLTQLREQAETEAINVFAGNLHDVLMAAPAGDKSTLGLDPGLRTGCKLAVVDETGKLLHTSTIFPHAPQNHWDKSVRTLVNICRQYKVELIAIGNGTGSRESDKLVAEAISQLDSNKPNKVIVSEAGASVYSASESAAQEFPDLDVSIRGAVSIARRLQDPLAELVKIDPKAIGVGQYQHDVSQSQLSATLDNVVEDCVNAVGVDLNSASAALLTRVSGLNKTMANNIVNYRDEYGRFTNRKQLKKVARLGPKAFEQAAGFLRITAGDNVLDQSGVHPETYPVVEKIISQLNMSLNEVINNSQLSKIDVNTLATAEFGVVTIKDIIAELEKPNRDPRPEFKTATFAEGVNTVADLKLGMILEGVVSNVANFGAFVDVGVHQDGLVHISSITDKFVEDPRKLVKAGDIVKVKVLEVDVERKRISLTMRLDEKATMKTSSNKSTAPKHKTVSQKPENNNLKQRKNKPKKVENAAMGNAFADAFAKLKK
ncbi:Tex family protein [Litorilituus lipolyticus]|uniref:RNA-binding transcriptional accessory protein n=1 Tax=Litorilituus lipolyticus TaxID=2491017 RepID=A0A502KQ77_9GAMM|nr:Tex family protein [Litorilituus lipolyticus]TPH13324.1 RNA-binding transcriptional accessory protein [Litorilituus lipolyticus]